MIYSLVFVHVHRDIHNYRIERNQNYSTLAHPPPKSIFPDAVSHSRNMARCHILKM